MEKKCHYAVKKGGKAKKKDFGNKGKRTEKIKEKSEKRGSKNVKDLT